MLSANGASCKRGKSASALNHPNIITIYDIANEAGIDFISMEYLPGKTPTLFLAAHAAGIVHRDLKPGGRGEEGGWAE